MREIPVIDADKLALAGEPSFAARHRTDAAQSRVAPDHDGDGSRVDLVHFVKLVLVVPIVGVGRKTPLFNDLVAPALKAMFRIIHERGFDLAESGVVFVEGKKPRLELQREAWRQFSGGGHQAFFVLN